MIDVTDATFAQDVIERSHQVPVVVDLWAPWCGPCRALGPIVENAVQSTGGGVELVKVNVDENPKVAASFQVQSIPAVYAVRDGNVVDGFIGALGEAQVTEFVGRLAPAPSEIDLLVQAGDEASLRGALEVEPAHLGAVVSMARLLVAQGKAVEAIELLERIPETPEARQVGAEARLAANAVEVSSEGVDVLLEGLLDRVKDDGDARQEFLDLLETLSPDDPRAGQYRRALASRLF